MESPHDLSTEWNRHLQANIDAMEGQTDAKGRRIRIVTMPEAVAAPSIHPKFCRS